MCHRSQRNPSPAASQDFVSKLGDTRVFLNKEKRLSTSVLFSSLRRNFTVLLQVTAPGTKSQKYQANYQVTKHLFESGERKNKKREHCSRQEHQVLNELDLKSQQKKQHLPRMGRKRNICQINRGAFSGARGCSELQQSNQSRLPSPQSDIALL